MTGGASGTFSAAQQNGFPHVSASPAGIVAVQQASPTTQPKTVNFLPSWPGVVVSPRATSPPGRTSSPVPVSAQVNARLRSVSPPRTVSPMQGVMHPGWPPQALAQYRMVAAGSQGNSVAVAVPQVGARNSSGSPGAQVAAFALENAHARSPSPPPVSPTPQMVVTQLAPTSSFAPSLRGLPSEVCASTLPQSPVQLRPVPAGGGWQRSAAAPPVTKAVPVFAWQPGQSQRPSQRPSSPAPSEPIAACSGSATISQPTLSQVGSAAPCFQTVSPPTKAMGSARFSAGGVVGAKPMACAVAGLHSPSGGYAAATLMGLIHQQVPTVAVPVQGAIEQELSSIHPISPGGHETVDDKEDLFEHCKDTTKLVSQLASVIRGLESDVEHLRRENRNLRKTVCANAEMSRQADLANAAQGLPVEQGPKNPVPLATPPLDLQRCVQPAEASTLTNTAPHQRVQIPDSIQQSPSSPPPTARIMQSLGSMKGQSVLAPSSPRASQAVASSVGGPTAATVSTTSSPSRTTGQAYSTDPFGMQTEIVAAASPGKAIQRSAVIERADLGVRNSPTMSDRAVAAPSGFLIQAVNTPNAQPKELLPTLEEIVSRGEAVKAEEVLIQSIRAGQQPSEACYDVIILALSRHGDNTRAEEWFRRMLEAGMVPSETSFNCVVLAACQEGDGNKVEETMTQMMRVPLRPSKDVFDSVLRLFASMGEAMKVEEWLLNAGQSGWTPEQAAFEAAVMLFADGDPVKADEWLSRAQQTEYRLPGICFCAVVQAFTHNGRIDKATDRLSKMIQNGHTPDETTVSDVVIALAEAGDVPLAEAWLAQLTARVNAPACMDDLRKVVFDAAMRARDFGSAEGQLCQFFEPCPERYMQLASAIGSEGDQERARAVLEKFSAAGTAPTEEITTALLNMCAQLKDSNGAESAAFSAGSALTDLQMTLLRQTVGDQHADEITKRICAGEGAAGDEGNNLWTSTRSFVGSVASPATGRSPNPKSSNSRKATTTVTISPTAGKGRRELGASKAAARRATVSGATNANGPRKSSALR